MGNAACRSASRALQRTWRQSRTSGAALSSATDRLGGIKYVDANRAFNEKLARLNRKSGNFAWSAKSIGERSRQSRGNASRPSPASALSRQSGHYPADTPAGSVENDPEQTQTCIIAIVTPAFRHARGETVFRK
jgi:hypothetical protein